MSAFHDFNVPFDRSFGKSSQRFARPHKRKRDLDADSDEGSDRSDGSHAEISHDSPSLLPSVPETAEPQLENVPDYPFPHAAPSSSAQAPKLRMSARPHDDFTTFNSQTPFDVTKQTKPGGGSPTTTKRRHVGVLTSILHRCLLRQDFLRAGRVFGLLLRTDVEGFGVDLRRNSLWSIGAEILLRAPGQAAALQRAAQSRSKAGDANRTEAAAEFFTLQGMERAKLFYERLILEFPWRPRARAELSSVHFYQAMFGLWIGFVHDQQTQREKNSFSEDQDLARHTESDTDMMAESSMQGDEAIENWEVIRQAGDIAKRMDNVLDTWPFSNDPGLWQLRGDVALWMADLMASSSVPSALGNGEEDGDGKEWGEEALRKRAQEAVENFKRLTAKGVVQSESEEGEG